VATTLLLHQHSPLLPARLFFVARDVTPTIKQFNHPVRELPFGVCASKDL
jgi:hypothetical protein